MRLKSFQNLRKSQRKTLTITGGIILAFLYAPPFTNGTVIANGF